MANKTGPFPKMRLKSASTVPHDVASPYLACRHLRALALVTQTATRVCGGAMQNVCRWYGDLTNVPPSSRKTSQELACQAASLFSRWGQAVVSS